MKSRQICVLVLLFFVAGCTMSPNVLQLRQDDGDDISRILYPIDPYTTVGVMKSADIDTGRFVAVLGTFPDGLFGEWDRLRIRYSGYAVDAAGKEYRVQSLFAGFKACSLRLIVLVEGAEKAEGLAIITLSTLTDQAYDLQGKPIKFGEHGARFVDLKKEERIRIARTFGSPVDSTPGVDGFSEALKMWNTFETPVGKILSPLGEDGVKAIAKHNPQYSFLEKVVGTGSFSVSPDWVSTTMNLVVESLLAIQAPSQGFDLNSVMPSRDYMGYQIAQLYRLIQAGQQECAIQQRP
ncbi:MAG: hypothetical protein IPK84_05215 [Candidatus Moraniibacteriota bacterium]|nr:MAG: hypothetical protein IPK84_05215 [Candidatus Moranbacteria bacterium]